MSADDPNSHLDDWPVFHVPTLTSSFLESYKLQNARALERLSDMTLLHSSLDMTAYTRAIMRATAGIEPMQRAFAAALPRWEETNKVISQALAGICDSGRLKAISESVAEASMQAAAIMERASKLSAASLSIFVTDHVIAKDIILDQGNISLAYEEDVVIEEIILDQQEIQLPNVPPPIVDESPTKHGMGTASAPTFLRTITVDLDKEEIYELLPPEADLIDETIALYEPHKAGIFILTTRGWKKEVDGVGKQSIRLIQYVRRIAKRTGSPCASLTELAEHLTKRAANLDHARSSVGNRIRRIRNICDEYNCKPILIKSGGLWRINPALSRWDNINYLPPVHK